MTSREFSGIVLSFDSVFTLDVRRCPINWPLGASVKEKKNCAMMLCPSVFSGSALSVTRSYEERSIGLVTEGCRGTSVELGQEGA